MKSKTCGECRYFDERYNLCAVTSDFCTVDTGDSACDDFEQKPKPTNGDVIRQGGNKELAEIFDDLYNGNKCRYCINNICGNCKFEDKHAEYDEGGWVEDEDCISGFEAWLNAPAESEGEDGLC